MKTAPEVQKDADAQGPRSTPATRPAWWVPVAACVVWLALWSLTPGLLSNGVGSWVTDDQDVAVLVESALALVVVAGLALLHRRCNRVLFARSRLMWLYALPAVLAMVLPLHYGMPAPVGVYMVWMSVSVFWQNYLTFGLLQSYLAERLPTWGTIALVAVMFWLGHALFLPHAFGPANPLAGLAMLTMGALFALLRARLGTLHLLLALHLAFYFIFA